MLNSARKARSAIEASELEVAARLVNRQALAWSARLGLSTLRNEVRSIGGGDALGYAFDYVNRIVPGHPAGAFFARRILEVDTLGGEVVFSDAFEPVGHSLPELGAALASTMSLRQRIRLYGLIDWKSGFSVFNQTAMLRDLVFRNSKARATREDLPAAERLRLFGPSDGFDFGSGTEANYIHGGSFVRLRELSLTFMLPADWASRLRATAGSLTFTGRNLALWTEYEGLDPEVVQSPSSQFRLMDHFSVPQARRLEARLTVQF